MLSEKCNIVCLMYVLAEYSDADHILPMREILSKLNSEFGISPDRRTIYSLVSVLKQIGFDISDYEENGIGYYLRFRLFEPGEVRLLMDAVYSFPFIPPKHTEDLVEKLQKLISVHERRRFKNLTVYKQEKKTPNRQVFYNIEQLDDAISREVKVRFTYLRYCTNKKLVPRQEGKYTVNPYGLVFTNENYYLVCIKEKKRRVSLYRIDRMSDIEITDLPLDPQDEKFDPKRAVSRAVYAYSGEPEEILMHCDVRILDHVIDKYGTDIKIREIDEDKLEIKMKVSPAGVKYWALQFLQHVEVVAPKWLRQEICECIKSNPYF
ncbi:MAG: WYL domain-containing protein [Clostridiales bacterium]|jgi:predicted DNA-binding transcriptional regulator YafY|nr:WYL domain-containing protein [Clostridiales bacterium]